LEPEVTDLSVNVVQGQEHSASLLLSELEVLVATVLTRRAEAMETPGVVRVAENTLL
jgi:hypothetical protein